MRKFLFSSLVVFAIASVNIKSFAQDTTKPQALKEDSSNLAIIPSTGDKKANEDQTKKDSQAPSLDVKKSDLISNQTENTPLVDSIQNGMASLLLGNKTTSLMFDDKENENIERALDSLKNNQLYVPEQQQEVVKKVAQDDSESESLNSKSYIYLGSIMYSNPQNWVVWINDKKITSEDNKKNKEIFVRSIERDRVSILWNISPSKLKVLLGKVADNLKLKTNLAGEAEVRFLLHPNQTFILGSNSVVEGKFVTNTTNKKDSFSDKVATKANDFGINKTNLTNIINLTK
ncbi:MAG: hypothetical protein EBS06_07120 [Proteobacteria bacterium]|nr:hypothetical protein [Pseudomonadota bacterium]